MPEDNRSPNDWLDPDQVSRQYGPKVQTLATWRHRKRGPKYSKHGRTVLYLRADIEAFLHACQVATEEKP